MRLRRDFSKKFGKCKSTQINEHVTTEYAKKLSSKET